MPSLGIRPPVVALLAGLAAYALHRLFPGPIWIPEWRRVVAIAMFLAAFIPPAWALLLFHRHETTHKPLDIPTAFVAEGPYRFTRNPMYLGVAGLLLAAAVWTGDPVMLLAPLTFVLIINAYQIPFEEARLGEIFGAPYEEYRRRVRRWL